MDLSELLNNSRLSSVCDHLVNGGDLDEYPERQSYAEEIKIPKKRCMPLRINTAATHRSRMKYPIL